MGRGCLRRTIFFAAHDSAPSPLDVIDPSLVSFCTTSVR